MTSDVLTVTIAGQTFANIVSSRIGRDLEQIAGTFQMTIVDDARLRQALTAQIGIPQPNAPVAPGQSVAIAIDGEPVLTGWIDTVELKGSGETFTAKIQGRDKTGDLVECAPPPTLAVEFRGVDLLHVANQVGAPFGITARADVDIGAPFDLLARHKHMTAMQFLDSGARQRSILLTSDGIGGLVLTRGGSSTAPAPVQFGEATEIEATFDWTRRFSDYFVIQDQGLNPGTAPGVLISSVPDDTDPEDAPDPVPSGAGAMGHATDPVVTRYRPTVRLTRSQSGMSSLQEQAEWACRVARGNAVRVYIPVLGYRAGPNKVLWRPNQITPVWDPYSQIDAEMLIAGVEFIKAADAQAITRLRVVGREAYDRINEADRKRHKKTGAATPNLITTVPGT